MSDIVTGIDQIAHDASRMASVATAEAVRSGNPAQGLAAIADEACRIAKRSTAIAKNIAHSLQLLEGGRFSYRTLDEAKALASLVASAFPDPAKVGVGVRELLVNAVEHGNLGISYEEKSRLLETDRLEEEAARRLALPQYAERYATVEIVRRPGSISLVVKDQGEGFDWKPYLEFAPERAHDLHGRGIATARLMCFSKLEYRGKGNEVVATLDLDGSADDGSERVKDGRPSTDRETKRV